MNSLLWIQRRLWPRRLRHQVLLPMVMIMVATMALLYGISTQRLADVAIESSRDWAESVARTAASAGAEPLAHNDRAKLEAALRDIVALHGVLRIDTLDPDGAPLLSLIAAGEGRAISRWRATDVNLPPASSRATRLMRAANEDALQAWSPVGPRGSLGSVGVTLSVEAERAHIDSLRYDAVVGIAFTGMLSTLAVYLLLARALAPLQRVVRFSRALAERTGERLEDRSGSHEVAELTEALNDASLTLREQLDEIRNKEDQTHAIVHAVPDAIIGFGEDGRVGIASPAVASIFGREPQELVGTPVEELLPGLTAADAEQRTLQGLFMRSSNFHLARFEAVACRHGGTEFPVEVSLSRTESATGVRYVCVVRDLTEKRMADEMLHLYSRALECTSNGIVISDMSLPGQPVFYANAAFGTITGYEPGDAIGRNCAFLQRDDQAQPEIDALRDAVREHRATRVVLRNYRKDGTLFFNELSISPVAAAGGSVRHYVGVINDVTERERARMAIAERSARLNAVFDLSPDGFVVFDRAGRLVFSNQAFQRMTGWDAPDELCDITVDEFDRRMKALCEPGQASLPLAQALKSGVADDAPELMNLCLPMHRVLARVVRGQPDGQGESILFFRDVTRETEVDRMKSEFLTTAAHELRTPMVSVFGFTELLLNRPVGEERRRDMLTTIHRQSSLLINMVNELLDLARIEARQGKDLKRESCRLGTLIEQAAAPFAEQHGDSRLRVAAWHGEAQLWVDPEKTHRLFTNVLSNAFKYSPEGGEIELTTVSGQLRGLPAVGVRITDHGIGMSPEQLRRVFERFYRADPSGNIPGTGLGMSLVKEIAELQGGQVELQSEPGHGTTVTVWFPLAAQATSPQALSPAQP